MLSSTAFSGSPDVAEVVFLDTSVLLNVLDVPDKNSDRDEVRAEFRQLVHEHATLVIPIAAVVEVGNHLAQLHGPERRDRTERFVGFLRAAVENKSPWVVSGASWDEAFLAGLLDGDDHRPGLVDLTTWGVGSGDVSILLELQRYRARTDLPSALPVRLWTLDAGPAAYA